MSKNTFALEMKDGVSVKTLEDLRNHFDINKVIEYFKSGDLVKWLEDKFYDDEAEALSKLKFTDKDLKSKLCEILEIEEDSEFAERVREKKAALEQMTDNDNIIDNAKITALNQDDLANLLHKNYKQIYLCGERFNVPIRIKDVHYIGILGTPKIKIKAQSDDDLKANGITFENCKLPYQTAAQSEQSEQLDELVDVLNRVREKKVILSQYTNDATIIDNAAITAITQDDLTTLLNMNYKTIYLCGEKFIVPIDVVNRNYIGILSTPQIIINASSEADLQASGITFENCQLPFESGAEVDMEQLRELFESIFTPWSEEYGDDVWEVVESNDILCDEPSDNKKKVALKLLCKNKYTEDDLIHVCIRSDFTAGWCFTKDSFCFYNIGGSSIVKYIDIDEATFDYNGFMINTGMLNYPLKDTFAYNFYAYENHKNTGMLNYSLKDTFAYNLYAYENHKKCIVDYLNMAKMLFE